jgi:hypothetical protein
MFQNTNIQVYLIDEGYRVFVHEYEAKSEHAIPIVGDIIELYDTSYDENIPRGSKDKKLIGSCFIVEQRVLAIIQNLEENDDRVSITLVVEIYDF